MSPSSVTYQEKSKVYTDNTFWQQSIILTFAQPISSNSPYLQYKVPTTGGAALTNHLGKKIGNFSPYVFPTESFASTNPHNPWVANAAVSGNSTTIYISFNNNNLVNTIDYTVTDFIDSIVFKKNNWSGEEIPKGAVTLISTSGYSSQYLIDSIRFTFSTPIPADIPVVWGFKANNFTDAAFKPIPEGMVSTVSIGTLPTVISSISAIDSNHLEVKFSNPVGTGYLNIQKCLFNIYVNGTKVPEHKYEFRYDDEYYGKGFRIYLHEPVSPGATIKVEYISKTKHPDKFRDIIKDFTDQDVPNYTTTFTMS